MAKKGQLKQPEEKSRAIARAIRVFEQARTTIAFFFIGGKLSSTQKDSPDFDDRVSQFSSSLVGVYDVTADYRDILDDIGAYYKMFDVPLPVPDLAIPVFRSSGRRK